MILLSEKSSSPPEIGESDSTRIFQRLAETNAVVQIKNPGTEQTIDGRVAGIDELTVEVRLAPPATVGGPLTIGDQAEVHFQLEQERLWFTTVIMATATVGSIRTASLRRPTRLMLRRRRRFWRTPIRSSTVVDVTARDARWSATGAMLNVSPAGLACLMDHPLTLRINKGDGVFVRFALEGEEKPTVVSAVLKAKTPAGTPAKIILRFGFESVETSVISDRISRATRVITNES